MLSSHITKTLVGLNTGKDSTIYAADNGPSISVNKLTGKAGALYEKMRYLVDYKEEHTIRRSAIERIIKRKLLTESVEKIGFTLLQELVGSGYLPNKVVSEGASSDIQKIVDKYLYLGTLSHLKSSRTTSLMASEIERFLYPQLINDLIIDCFYETINSHIVYKKSISDDALKTQTYVGCRRTLLEDDQDTLFYAVLVKHLPELPKVSSHEELKNIAESFARAVLVTEKDIDDSLGWKLSSKLRNYSIYFSVVKEIIKRYGTESEAIFADDARLEEEARKILTERYAHQFALTRKSGTRAVIYILLTKIIVAFALELPYEVFILRAIDYIPLGTNIIFHPLLLLVMTKTIKAPSEENTAAIVAGVKTVVRNETINPIYVKSASNDVFLNFTYGVLYAALFVISFGAILWVLDMLHFNIVSVALFLFFLTLVSYFGFRIRHNARKWRVTVEDDSALSLLWNFFTIPIVRTGRWLSRHFSSINIFVFIMDFILETPFKFILGTFDSFISFIKEKREDPY